MNKKLMIVKNKNGVQSCTRGGLRSHVYLQKGDIEGSQLAVTWVEVEPGGRQRPHHHPAEQVYVIVQGSGEMAIDGERRPVGVGDLIYIPGNSRHGIENNGSQRLIYVSAATPNWDIDAVYQHGQLATEGEST